MLRAGTMAAVTGTAPDGDLAVVAELQGMLIEILEKRNAELTAQVADLSERLVKLERAVSRNSGFSELRMRGGLTGWRLVPSAGVPDRVEDEVDVGLVESGDDVSQGDG